MTQTDGCTFFNLFVVCPQSSCVGGPGFNWVWDGIWRCCSLHKTVSTKHCTNNCSVFSCAIFTNNPLIFLNIVSCFEHTVSFMLAGSAVERSTPSSCSTWKTTKLNCVCAPKMPTDRAAAYSRNLRPPVHLHCSFTGDFHLLKLKGILVTLKQMEIIQNTSCISKY